MVDLNLDLCLNVRVWNPTDSQPTLQYPTKSSLHCGVPTWSGFLELVMFTKKDIVACQRMLDYLEAYDHLLDKQTEFLAKSISSRDKTTKRTYRKFADETNIALKKVAERALNDKQIGS